MSRFKFFSEEPCHSGYKELKETYTLGLKRSKHVVIIHYYIAASTMITFIKHKLEELLP